MNRQGSEALKSDCLGSEFGHTVLIAGDGWEWAAETERSLRQKNGESNLAESFPVLEAFPVLFVSLSTAAERGNQLRGLVGVLKNSFFRQQGSSHSVSWKVQNLPLILVLLSLKHSQLGNSPCKINYQIKLKVKDQILAFIVYLSLQIVIIYYNRECRLCLITW